MPGPEMRLECAVMRQDMKREMAEGEGEGAIIHVIRVSLVRINSRILTLNQLAEARHAKRVLFVALYHFPVLYLVHHFHTPNSVNDNCTSTWTIIRLPSPSLRTN
jgi:hypothetical protein